MATLIHITDFRNVAKIRKNGITCQKLREGRKGLYCFPVLPDFNLTHQWSRELKRTGVRSLACIQFKISDDEMIELGTYHEQKNEMTAAEAIKTLMTHDGPMGMEVIIRRNIQPKEIMRVYPAPRVVGWRYYPEAKGRMPFCSCKYCNSGQIKARRLIKE